MVKIGKIRAIQEITVTNQGSVGRSLLLTRVVLVRNNRKPVAWVGFLDLLSFFGMIKPKVIGLSQTNHTTYKIRSHRD